MKIIFKSKIYFSIINCGLYIFRRNPKVVPNQTKTPHSINTLFIYQIRFALAQHTTFVEQNIFGEILEIWCDSDYEPWALASSNWITISNPAVRSTIVRLKPFETIFDRIDFCCGSQRVYLFYMSHAPIYLFVLFITISSLLTDVYYDWSYTVYIVHKHTAIAHTEDTLFAHNLHQLD